MALAIVFSDLGDSLPMDFHPIGVSIFWFPQNKDTMSSILIQIISFNTMVLLIALLALRFILELISFMNHHTLHLGPQPLHNSR